MEWHVEEVGRAICARQLSAAIPELVALTGDQGELALGPGEEGRDFRGAVLLACCKADVGRTAGDLALDVIERADAVERLAGDRGFGLVPFIVEVASQMGPTGCLPKAGDPSGSGS
jgi:hypothetical protein